MILVTCEHASREVPEELRPMFRGQAALLRSHRGYDIGALDVAAELADTLGAPLVLGGVSRLVIDLNRSLTNPCVFSELTRYLPAAQRRAIVERYYLPYRSAVEQRLTRAIAAGRSVLHLSVHSFTPQLAGRAPRCFDLGLLYDPSRARERELCAAWAAALAARSPTLRVRLNLPYRGWTDGMTTTLRRRFRAPRYRGIEIELNQATLARPAARTQVAALLAETLTSLGG